MKQRFGIAQALLCDPRLIIVDEPTAGLDPAERLRFLNLLSDIGENIVDEPPVRAGIDPFHKLIDRNPDDNLTRDETVDALTPAAGAG